MIIEKTATTVVFLLLKIIIEKTTTTVVFLLLKKFFKMTDFYSWEGVGFCRMLPAIFYEP